MEMSDKEFIDDMRTASFYYTAAEGRKLIKIIDSLQREIVNEQWKHYRELREQEIHLRSRYSTPYGGRTDGGC